MRRGVRGDRGTGKRYFYQLLDSLEDTPESAIELLALSRGMLETFQELEKRLLKGLTRHRLLAERVERLQSIRGVGQVTALTWALEIAEAERFSSVRRAVSYCGLCAAERESAGKTQRRPLSKQRNKHLQTVLIEAAKLAPRFNLELKAVHERELAHGSRNRATLAVARKLVAYLLAVDRSGTPSACGSSGLRRQDSERCSQTSRPPVLALRGLRDDLARDPMRPSALFRGRRATTQTQTTATAPAARCGTWLTGHAWPLTP